MKWPRITIARMMAAVAVIAFDCFMFVMTAGVGVLLIGLALTVGVVCWWRGQGEGKRFWLGFEMTGLAGVLAFIGYVKADGWIDILPWAEFVANHGPWIYLAGVSPLLGGVVVSEVSYGVPMLLIASIGGLLATLTSRGAPTTRIQRAGITMNRLMAAISALALILGLAVTVLRSKDPHPSLRVFNRTNTPLDNLQLQYKNLGQQPYVGTTILGGTFVAPEILEPGGMTSWDFGFFSQTGFTLSCATSDGTVKTGRANVNLKEDSPRSLDFYVEPAGVKAVIVPRPWWLR